MLEINGGTTRETGIWIGAMENDDEMKQIAHELVRCYC